LAFSYSSTRAREEEESAAKKLLLLDGRGGKKGRWSFGRAPLCPPACPSSRPAIAQLDELHADPPIYRARGAG
jgi:hypothetical protein